MLSNKQLYFSLMVGCITLMPIVTYSQFHFARQLVEYSQYGSYNTDCMIYYFPTFNYTSFTSCRSDNIQIVAFYFAVTVTIFLVMASRVYLFVTKEIKHIEA